MVRQICVCVFVHMTLCLVCDIACYVSLCASHCIRAIWYAPPDLLGTYYGIMLSVVGLMQIAINSIVVELMLTYAPAGLQYVFVPSF